MGEFVRHYREPLRRDGIPEPVLDAEPGLIELYWRAWELAWEHVLDRAGAPQSPYMDEAFDPDTIWIWDTCFMAQFCKYAPELFYGVESFDNFYLPLHAGAASTLTIHHPDNPPLFAWIEREYGCFTGDRARLDRVAAREGWLVRHYAFIENARVGTSAHGARCPMACGREPLGYRWSGVASGMDNTPRGRGDYADLLWVDLLAQQGLAATCIADLAERHGDPALADEYRRCWSELRDLANRHYWDETDGIYYDLRASPPHAKVKVKTPAAYWPLLAGFCTPAMAARLADHARNPLGFGGDIPWPSVDRRDPDYASDGEYWRGGVWVPTAYMATKALQQNGYMELACDLAGRLVRHMLRTYREYEPHTIWEAYSPTTPRPSTDKKPEFTGRIVRPDFCGWSALGPIALLIENVLGFHRVDAWAREVHWRPRPPGRQGIRRLRFGGVSTDIVMDVDGRIEVSSTGDYRLVVGGVPHAIRAGRQRLPMQSGGA